MQHQSHRNIRRLAITFTAFAVVGFFDATYLTMKHFLGGVVPCLTGGCELVTTSEYATIIGIPVALLGAVYYLCQLILAIAHFESGSLVPLRLGARLSIVGLLASGYFVSLQLFVIHAICDKCMLSALSSTALFITGIYIQKHLKGGSVSE